LTAPIAIVVLAIAPAGAAALQFSAPVTLDDDGGSAQLSSVSCPVATQCTALDGIGQETTFNPQQPGGFAVHQVEVGAALEAVACPSSTECVAIDGAQQGSHVGDELTFDPSSPGPPSPHSVDTAPLVGLACPAASQCVAIDNAGSEVSFDPQNLTNPAPTKVKLNTSSGAPALNAVACSSIAECTVIDANGYYYTFNPETLTTTPAATGQLSLLTQPPIFAVSCPTAVTCVALQGTVDGVAEVDFNPTVSNAPFVHSLETSNEPLGITCTSAAQCIAIDSTGGGASDVLIFDPSNGVATPRPIQPASAIACPPGTTDQCTTVGAGGNEQTFDPSQFAAPVIFDVDPGNPLVWVSCAVASQCTAIDGRGREYTFDPDPSYVSRLTSHQVTTDELPLSFIACPAVDQCTGISGTTENTFDPQLPGTPSSQYFSTVTISGFGCPLASECVAVGDNSAGVEQGVTTFDPAHAFDASTTPVDNSLGEPSGLSCPTSTQCTTLAGGDEYTFAPTDRTGQLTAITPQLITTGTENYTAVSCPSVTQCTAIADVSTGGDAITFNPKSPAEVSPTAIDSSNSPTSISCPTTSFCAIVDSAGNALVGNPAQLASFAPAPIASAGPLESVDCTSAAQCVAVDANGRTFFSGRGGRPPVVIRPPQPKPKAKPPTISGASLSIGSHGKAKLRFTVHAGAHAPRIRSFTVTLGGGLRFKGSVKHVRVSGKVRLAHGKLIVTLKRAALQATPKIGSPPLQAPRHKRRFVLKVAVTDTAGKKTTITHTFRR
ncbi:MAG TPA: hypothetical protein VGI86_20270, partial [Acidimicrobiia bacterium]